MTKFTIQPHGRLQEWIAHEKRYFSDAGLDYEFCGGLSAERKKQVDASGKIVDVFSGAFETYERGKGNEGERENAAAAIESHPRGSLQRHDDGNCFRQSLAIQSSRDLDHGQADGAGTCLHDGGSGPVSTGPYGPPTGKGLGCSFLVPCIHWQS